MEPHLIVPFEESVQGKYYYLYLMREDGSIGRREVVTAAQDPAAIAMAHERLSASDFPAGEIWELGRFVSALTSRKDEPATREPS